MCHPASMIVRRTSRPYWSPNTESHEEMLKELGLRDTTLDPQFVRVEITPPSGNMLAPLSDWQYRVDQDFRPDWYEAADAEEQVRAALPDWVRMKVLVDGQHEVQSGNRFAYGSASVEAWGSSRVVAWGSSRVEAWGSSSVEARESSSVEAWGSSRVEAWESSSVEAWGSSRVVAWGSSSVEAWGSSRVVAWGSSSVEAWGSSRVEARESSSVVAWGSSSVEAWESSSVVAWGNSTLNQWSSACTVTLADRAVNIRRDSSTTPVPVERAKAARPKKIRKPKK